MLYIHAIHFAHASDLAKRRGLKQREWRFVQSIDEMGAVHPSDTLLLANVIGSSLEVWNQAQRIEAFAKGRGLTISRDS